MDEGDDDDDDDDEDDDADADEAKAPVDESGTMEWTYEGRPIKVEIEEEPTSPPQSQHPSTSTSVPSRFNQPTFVSVTENEKNIYVKKMKNKNIVKKVESSFRQKNKNTLKKVVCSSRQFQRWLAEPPRCDERAICDIMPPELDDYIGTFLLSIRKADGSDYEPGSLTSYHRGLDSYLKDNQYPYSIINDKEFENSRQLLASKRKELIRKGKGNRPNAVGPLRAGDRTRLREKNVIGLDTPTKLLHLMWFNNTVLFGIKGAIENRRLRWGDLTLKIDDNGREYLEYNERLTKTRTGANPGFKAFNPKQYAHASLDTCPVHAYKVFMFHRPEDMCEPQSPFYLSINYKRLPESDRWYKSQPLGQNSLRSLTKKLAVG